MPPINRLLWSYCLLILIDLGAIISFSTPVVSPPSFATTAAVVPLPTPLPTSTLTPIPPTPTLTPLATPTFPAPLRPTTLPVTGPPPTGLNSLTVATTVGNFAATVLRLDFSTARMLTDTGSDTDCPTACPVKALAEYVTTNSGFAGINGTYFCPETYTECAAKTNSFDFPVYNSRLSRWINAANLSWGERRAIIYQDGSGFHYLHQANSFSGSLTAGIINYPGLLDGGRVQIDENQSGLSAKQQARNLKIGLGIIDSQKLLVVVAPAVTMREFAYIFQGLGASGALNLDTGGSLALYLNGHYVYGPGRSLPNAVVFTRR